MIRVLAGAALGAALALAPRVVGYAQGKRCLTRCGHGHSFGVGCLRRNW